MMKRTVLWMIVVAVWISGCERRDQIAYGPEEAPRQGVTQALRGTGQTTIATPGVIVEEGAGELDADVADAVAPVDVLEEQEEERRSVEGGIVAAIEEELRLGQRFAVRPRDSSIRVGDLEKRYQPVEMENWKGYAWVEDGELRKVRLVLRADRLRGPEAEQRLSRRVLGAEAQREVVFETVEVVPAVGAIYELRGTLKMGGEAAEVEFPAKVRLGEDLIRITGTLPLTTLARVRRATPGHQEPGLRMDLSLIPDSRG